MRRDSLGRTDLERAGVTLYEHAGAASFADPHRIECETGPRLRADKIIVCTGGMPRRLELPGSELAGTHSDAWAMSSVPRSMLVVGAGATGVQVASIFNAFGSRVTLFEAAPHILMSEDRDVSATVAAALRASGIDVVEDAGAIERFEPCPTGVRLIHSNNGLEQATVAIVAVGWRANTAALNLPAAGVQLDERGYVRVDAELHTTAPHVFAAGDVTGRAMVVHEAIREGYLAATNAVLGATTALPAEVSPLGSFTDPEYASVGLTEASARQNNDVIVATQRLDAIPRPIIDGRPTGFCKLIVDRRRHTVLGCHIVGERAVELAQVAAIVIASGMTVKELALVPFSFPTYANALARAAVNATRELASPSAPNEDALAGFG